MFKNGQVADLEDAAGYSHNTYSSVFYMTNSGKLYTVQNGNKYLDTLVHNGVSYSSDENLDSANYQPSFFEQDYCSISSDNVLSCTDGMGNPLTFWAKNDNPPYNGPFFLAAVRTDKNTSVPPLTIYVLANCPT